MFGLKVSLYTWCTAHDSSTTQSTNSTILLLYESTFICPKVLKLADIKFLPSLSHYNGTVLLNNTNLCYGPRTVLAWVCDTQGNSFPLPSHCLTSSRWDLMRQFVLEQPRRAIGQRDLHVRSHEAEVRLSKLSFWRDVKAGIALKELYAYI